MKGMPPEWGLPREKAQAAVMEAAQKLLDLMGCDQIMLTLPSGATVVIKKQELNNVSH